MPAIKLSRRWTDTPEESVGRMDAAVECPWTGSRHVSEGRIGKRQQGFIVRLFFLLAFVATPAQAALNIFACEPEWAALAKELGGDKVEVYSATTARQDPHLIQARPGLIARMRTADLAVCTGADLELGWLPMLQTKANNPKVQNGQPGMFEASQYVEMLEIPVKIDRSQGDVHPYGNPHIQMNPYNIQKVATALAERLATIDPKQARYYSLKHAEFEKRWLTAIKKWEQLAAPLKGVPIISDHRGWTYLYAWLGMEEVGTLEARPGIPPSASHLQSLLETLKQRPAKMILRAIYAAERPAQWLAKRSGLPVVDLPFTVGGTEEASDLFGLYDDSLQRLLRALGS